MFNINSQKVARNTNIKMGSRLLMAEIISLSNARYGCIASNKTFSSYIGVSERQIQRYLEELKDNGYIEIANEEMKKELQADKFARLIVPTNIILLDLPTARKNFKQDYEKNSEWIDKLINELDNNPNIK